MRFRFASLLGLVVPLLAGHTADAEAPRHEFRRYTVVVVRGTEPPRFIRVEREPVPPGKDQHAAPRRNTLPAPPDPATAIPVDWKLAKTDPAWPGRRYVSADGQSWISAYAEAADARTAEYLRRLAFREGETVTKLNGGESWVVVQGLKSADKAFFRKAILACGGRSWHLIDVEYKSDLQPQVEGLLTQAAAALDDTRTDCAHVVAQR